MKKIIALIVTGLLFINFVSAAQELRVIAFNWKGDTEIMLDYLRFDDEISRVISVSYKKDGKAVLNWRQDCLEHNSEVWMINKNGKAQVALVSEATNLIFIIECKNSKDAAIIASKIMAADAWVKEFTSKTTFIPQKISTFGNFILKENGKSTTLPKIVSVKLSKSGIQIPTESEQTTYRQFVVSSKAKDKFAVADYYLNNDFVICKCTPWETAQPIVLNGSHVYETETGCNYETIPIMEDISACKKEDKILFLKYVKNKNN